MRGVRSGEARTCKPVIPPKESRGVQREGKRDCTRGKGESSKLSRDNWAFGRDPESAGPGHGRTRVFTVDKAELQNQGTGQDPCKAFLAFSHWMDIHPST